uniref:Cx9C motif-containing protein 4 n=1 Tax=Ananas comosus var. bracteatus TaxID=296719 RepID=A0A6V7QFZ0_ANACO|nr:unnamed protein product [Ananas comosus var. bracteatus]
MAQKSKEPCKKEACDIQACLTKNNFDPQRCLKVIELLQSCCEKCEYKSTHCASLSGLLKTSSKISLFFEKFLMHSTSSPLPSPTRLQQGKSNRLRGVAFMPVKLFDKLAFWIKKSFFSTFSISSKLGLL